MWIDMKFREIINKYLVVFLWCWWLKFILEAKGECDSQIYCSGSLLKKIQLSGIYNDSKTFVDKPTIKPLDEVLAAASLLPENSTNDELQNFLSTYFGPEGQELILVNITNFNSTPSFLQKIKSPLLQEFAKRVHNYWPNLTREVNQSFMCEGCVSSFIALNRTFVIPGGRFREIYYWDSYFIIEGLLVSELYDIAKNVILNLLDLVEIYGFVPNGSRIYYLNRSQPPLLVQMVKIYYQATNDTTLLYDAFPILIKEYNFWRQNNSIRIISPKSKKLYTLNRYIVNNNAPRPESYLDDFNTVELNNTLNSTAREELYADIATTAESGWDFSSRWVKEPFKNSSTNDNNYEILRTLNADVIIPIDLNSILYMNEITLSEFSEKVGEEKMIDTFKNAAKKRLEGITDLFWDEELELFMDYNISSESRSEVFSLASYFPFWAESLPKDFITNSTTILDTFSYITDLLSKYPGSPPTTLINSGLQWDFPNSWPPLNYVLIKGLINFHHRDDNDSESEIKEFIMNSTKNLSQRYVDSVLCAWYSTGGSIPGYLNKLSGVEDTGHIFEKYSTLELSLPGGGGVGFGWTNGVLLWIFSNFGDILEEPECLSDLT
ncbi:1715_t:CDS:2 [Diversispora eburnea]|uniref:Trehalase n=1 Tax=Diversispora eburnea TaxID=1213867 RepID=A0A9N8VE02_9GLOM|nr:1715_t:CDS:2 [Diversispora eburnea]